MSEVYSLELKSEFTEAEKIPDFVEMISDQSGLDESLTHRIMLALSEAVTNAIVHGNKEIRDKKVSIKITINSSMIVIDIQDEGEGFNPDDIPDPVDEKNLLATGGRGLFLMEEFADHVEYRNKGRLVIMKFER